MIESELEIKLASALINFNNTYVGGLYKIRKLPAIKSERNILISLCYPPENPDADYKEGKIIFKHGITLNTMGDEITSELTMSVDISRSARGFYIEFLEYLEKEENIKLTNQFSDLWKKNPEKYPI